MRIDFRGREAVGRVILWGPSGGGKTQTLQHLQREITGAADGQGEALEYLPIELREPVDGYQVSVDLAEVPAGFAVGPKLLRLKDVDVVIFVADSRAEADAENAASLAELDRSLAEFFNPAGAVRFLFQYNRHDAEGHRSQSQLDALLNARGAPSFCTVATQGAGVMDAFQAALKLVRLQLRRGTQLLSNKPA